MRLIAYFRYNIEQLLITHLIDIFALGNVDMPDKRCLVVAHSRGHPLVDTWQFVAVTYDGTYGKFYFNDEETKYIATYSHI